MVFKFVNPASVTQSAIGVGVPQATTKLNFDTNLEPNTFQFVNPALTREYLEATKEVKGPGFIETLKNPFELWRYNSLPVAAYQLASGNTKGKQAQESFDWLQNNPDITSGPEYQKHFDMYQRYGYALSNEQFSFEKVREGIQNNPGMFAGEMVNALVADPYLMLPWFWGGWAIKAAQATKIGMQLSSIAPRITKGTLTAAGATPTLATYSTIQQLSETGELDLNRIQGEVMLGGGAAFVIGALGAGTSSKASKILGLTHDEITYRMKKNIDDLAKQGDPYAQRIINDSAKGTNVFEESLKSIIKDIEASDININNIRDIDIPTVTKEWKNSKYSNQFKDVNEYVGFVKEFEALKNNKRYNKLPNEVLEKKAKENYAHKTEYVSKVNEALIDEIMPSVRDSYNQMIIGGIQKYANIRSIINNKALIQGIETAGAVGLAGGIGYYLSNPKDGAFWQGLTTAAAGVGLWKAGGSIYARNKMLRQGEKLVKGSKEELGIRIKEIETDLPEGVKLEDIGVHKTPEFYTDSAISKADIRRLGRAEEIQLAKGEMITGYLLDGYRNAVQISAIDSNRMKEIVVAKVPQLERRQAITRYIQEKTKETKLSDTELAVAKDVMRVMDEMYKVTQGTELRYKFFDNYLPQYWRFSGRQSDALGDPTLSEALKKLILDTSKRDNTLKR